MQHRVAVWADWPQVGDRIDRVLLGYRRNLPEMVHVDVAFSQIAVSGAEIDAIYGAIVAVMFNTVTSGFGISLIGDYHDLLSCALF